MDQPKANQRADLLYLLQEFSRVAEVRVCGRSGIRGFGRADGGGEQGRRDPGLNESSPPLPSWVEERAARPPCAALLVFAAFVSAELNESAKEKDLTNTHGGRTCPRRPSQYILAVMRVR